MSKWKQNKGKANGNAQKGGATAAVQPQGGGMISEADKYNERHGRRSGANGQQRKQQEAAPSMAAQTQKPVQSARLTQAAQPVQAAHASHAANQSSQQGDPAQLPEPQKKSALKRIPEPTPASEPTWESKVDDCLDRLTKLTSDHHKTLDDHGRRLRKLERWQEKDEVFAKKVAPVIAELQRDKELSDERMAELEDQFWSIWAHHLGVDLTQEPDVKAGAKLDAAVEPEEAEDDVKTVEDLVALELASKSVTKPDSAPVPDVKAKPAVQMDGRPKLIFKYWDFRTRLYGLTADIWAAKQIDDDYVPVWAWYVNESIDHLMDADEIRKYCP